MARKIKRGAPKVRSLMSKDKRPWDVMSMSRAKTREAYAAREIEQPAPAKPNHKANLDAFQSTLKPIRSGQKT